MKKTLPDIAAPCGVFAVFEVSVGSLLILLIFFCSPVFSVIQIQSEDPEN